MLQNSLKTIGLVILFSSNYFSFLWQNLEFLESEVNHLSKFLRALAFSSIEILRGIIGGFPIKVYESLVIEEEFGFNKQTIKLLVKD